MADALKKFKLLENKTDEAVEKKSVEKPVRKKKEGLYSHLASKFETNNDTKEERRRIVQERLKERQLEKEAKIEAERRRREEEQEKIRRLKEEEERQRKLREEEEARKRIEEEQKFEEEEEERRLAKIKQQKEGKYKGLKPAAAMFERAMDAKKSVQNSIRGERVVTLRKGTISELRSKIFDNPPPEVSLQKPQQKPKK